MLTIQNLCKQFQQNKVINELNLKIDKGECIYIHGKNGCGKSTLFKLICDILKADQGQIIIDNDTYIGALIENPGFIEGESLKFNLSFLASLNNKYNENRIIELCQYFSLDYNDKTPLKNYSVGMRQKVGIIQAIMEDQNLILLDEPTRGLDEESIKVFERIMTQLYQEGKSIVIASHDFLENMNFTKIYLLENGKLIEE